jgi:CPA2 family monovalent cation:H+ antiporter-2
MGLGVALGLMPERGRDLILAGAILSILLNPVLFSVLDHILAKSDASRAPAGEDEGPPREPVPMTSLTGHVVLVGHGRVGSFISEALGHSGAAVLVIDSDSGNVERARQQGLEALEGNATDPDIIAAANLPAARCLLVAVPDGFEGGQIVEQGRTLNPALTIIARAHSADEIEHLKRHGATAVVMSEHEIAKAMIAGVPA